jgi:hypothetical protein
MKHKILKWLNWNILPLSYKLWKESKDDVYNKIANKYKINWLDTQLDIISNMTFPFFIGIIGFLLSIYNGGWFIAFMTAYLTLFIIIQFQYNDKYTDEKYILLSKNDR